MSALTLVRPSVLVRRIEAPAAPRVGALDVMRGFAVAGMLAVNNPGIRDATPPLLAHSTWNGFTLADAIFPLFLFAAGASIPFSRRASSGGHAARRVAILFALGVGLSTLKYHHLSGGSGVLQRVALAYGIGWLILRAPRRWQVAICGGILAAVWAGFRFAHPSGVIAGSWLPGTNLADFVDRHVLGSFSSEGILGTFTAAVNVVGGAMCGRFIKESTDPRSVLVRLGFVGAALLAAGGVWAVAVPINKQLWTPSYTVVSLGFSCVALALLFWFCDTRWRPEPVAWMRSMGANPLAIYVLVTAASYTIFAPVRDATTPAAAALVGRPAASLAWALCVVVIGWALSAWFGRRRIFIRV